MLSINRKTLPLPSPDAKLISEQLLEGGTVRDKANAMVVEKVDVGFQILNGIRNDMIIMNERLEYVETQTPGALFHKHLLKVLIAFCTSGLIYLLGWS